MDNVAMPIYHIYCEETGGDYFDFHPTGINVQRKLKIVVGDVSDHGIASALLMTTAGAFIRQRASRTGNLNQIVSDVIRANARKSARDILQKVLDEIYAFCHPWEKDDDVTLVVVKVEA